MDLTTFTLDGGAKKSIRNALKKVAEKGYQAKVYQAPISDGLLQKLKSVSDEWLADTERSEIVFSQGMFEWDELKQQTILTVENSEEKIVAFLNVIPDYAPGEGTYDLILMSSVAHHFTDEQNFMVAQKVARALKPGGVFIINEFVRPDPSAAPELVGSSTDLFFGLTSTSGNWSVAEMNAWQRAAGLTPLRPVGYRALPGRFQVGAKK